MIKIFTLNLLLFSALTAASNEELNNTLMQLMVDDSLIVAKTGPAKAGDIARHSLLLRILKSDDNETKTECIKWLLINNIESKSTVVKDLTPQDQKSLDNWLILLKSSTGRTYSEWLNQMNVSE